MALPSIHSRVPFTKHGTGLQLSTVSSQSVPVKSGWQLQKSIVVGLKALSFRHVPFPQSMFSSSQTVVGGVGEWEGEGDWRREVGIGEAAFVGKIGVDVKLSTKLLMVIRRGELNRVCEG